MKYYVNYLKLIYYDNKIKLFINQPKDLSSAFMLIEEE